MSQIIKEISEEQKKIYNKKFEYIKEEFKRIQIEKDNATSKMDAGINYHERYNKTKRNILSQGILHSAATDPTVFAYLFLRDKKGEPLKLFDYQDLIINDKANLVCIVKGRKIGMTYMISLLALHQCIFNDNFTIVVASKTKPMAKRIIEIVKEFLRTAPYFKYEDVTGGKEATDNKFELWIKNKGGKTYSKIISVIAGDSARGEDANLVIVDEAAFVEDGDRVYHEILGPMVTFHGGRTFLISTPPPYPMGYFYDAYRNDTWSRYHFSTRICPAVSDEYLQEKRDSMLEAQYQREYEGKFFSNENRVFTTREIEDAIDEKLEPGLPTQEAVFIGVDWGETQSQSAWFVIKAEFKDGEVSTEEVDKRTYPKRTDYMEVIRDIQRLCNKYTVRMILADAGIGRGQISVMNDMRANGTLRCDMLEEYSFGGTRKSDLVTEIKLLFEKRRVKISNDNQLRDELEVYQAEYNQMTGRTKYHAPAHGRIKDHLLDAFMLANMAAVRMASPPVTMTIVGGEKKCQQEMEQVQEAVQEVQETEEDKEKEVQAEKELEVKKEE